MLKEHKFNIEKSFTPARDSHAFFFRIRDFSCLCCKQYFLWVENVLDTKQKKGRLFARKEMQR